MRMLRVALVLLVLASFVGATVTVSMAATVTPTVKPTVKATVKPTANATAKATMKPMGTMAPIKKTGKMIDLQQMKTNIGNVFKKLQMGTKMPAKPAMPKNNTTAMGGVNKTTGAVNKTTSGMSTQKSPTKYSPSMKLSTPSMRSIQTPAIMNQLGTMPKVSSVN